MAADQVHQEVATIASVPPTAHAHAHDVQAVQQRSYADVVKLPQAHMSFVVHLFTVDRSH